MQTGTEFALVSRPMDAEQTIETPCCIGQIACSKTNVPCLFRVWFHRRMRAEWMGEEGLMRPDRVVRNEEGWHVVDYKTGEVNVDTHAKQVRKYMRTLAALDPPNLVDGSSTSTLCDLWRSFPTRHLVSSRRTDSPLLRPSDLDS